MASALGTASQHPPDEPDDQPGEGKMDDEEMLLRRIVAVVVSAVALVVGGAFGWKILTALTPGLMADVLRAHFGAVAMAPLIAMTSFVIVMVFRAASGPVEFEALGFKFKGASGEAVMWIACVLALTVATKILM
jgi:large-conductance mechanosensitive channel